MNYIPIDDKIIILPKEIEDKTPGGLYIPDNAKEKPQIGNIIAIGPNVKQCNITDIALYGKYAGTEIIINDIKYVILKEKDILAINKGENK